MNGSSPWSSLHAAAFAILALVGGAGCPGDPVLPDDDDDSPSGPPPGVEFVTLKAPSHRDGLSDLYSSAEAGEPTPFASHVTRLRYSPDDRWLDDFSGGLAVLDCDGDDDADFLFTSGDGANSLWLGDGGGGFEKTSHADVVFLDDFTAAASVADVDNDGDTDILLLNQLSPNRLLINDGACRFEDRAEALGLHDDARSAHAVWVDFDLDGRLDLYVSNYAGAAPTDDLSEPAPLHPDRMWLQNEDGTFRDVTAHLPPDNLDAWGMATAFIDWDGDGDGDLFQTNDRGGFAVPNRAYRNDGVDGDGNPVLTDVSSAWGFSLAIDGMGLAFADPDGDGDPDVFNSGNPEEYFRNDDGSLLQATQASGLLVNTPFLMSWGADFFDADGDGDEELLFVESFFVEAAFDDPADSEGSIWLFDNQFSEGGAFALRTDSAGSDFAALNLWRAAAVVDVDGDGFEDVLVNPVQNTPVLFRNNPNEDHGVVQVRLRGTRSNREGRGAVVRLTAGGRVQTRWPGASLPFAVGLPTWMTFGVGEAESVGPLEITWPSGEVQRIDSVPAGHRVMVTEPQ